MYRRLCLCVVSGPWYFTAHFPHVQYARPAFGSCPLFEQESVKTLNPFSSSHLLWRGTNVTDLVAEHGKTGMGKPL